MSNRTHPARDAAAATLAGLTTWLTLMAWGGFVQRNDTYLAPLLLGIACTATVGVLARTFRMPLVLVLASQLLMIVLFINWAWGSEFLPTPSSIETVVEAIRDAMNTAQEYAAPIAPSVPSIAPLLVIGGLLAHLAVDLIAVTFRRPTAAGLALLAIYSLPISALDSSTNWIVFSFSALGYLSMIALEESVRVARWGRTVGDERPIRAFNDLAGTGRHPLGIGVGATALAVVLPLFIPTMQWDLFGFGPGSGSGGGREVTLKNPMTDLRRDLVLGEDVPLLQIRTEQSAPTYLRVTNLTNYNGSTWTPGARDLPAVNAASGPIPTPPGLTPEVERRTASWEVAADENLDSAWLPTSEFVTAIDAGDDWRYDSEILDFHGARDSVTTRGLDYRIDPLIPIFDQQQLRTAGPAPGDIRDDYTPLPGGLPGEVTDLAAEVTQGAGSDYERAIRLQNWFRSEGGFEYSTDPDEAPSGNGNDELVAFLDEKEGRVGYCEQYASAMAVMARSLNIPSRVVVGFLRGTTVAPDTFEFSSHDLHAWPELYFEGSGWVRFEPTPAQRVPTSPQWTRSENDPNSGPSGRPSDTRSTRSNQPSGPSQPSSSATQEENQEAAGGAGNDGSFPWVPVGTVFALIVAGGLLLLPHGLRAARTRRRWAATDPAESAWLELRDLMLDLGYRWPVGRSPRVAGEFVRGHFGAVGSDAPQERPRVGPEENPEANAALDRLLELIEVGRYAPTSSPTTPEEAQQLLALCADALRAGASPRVRRRAVWMPASLWGVRRGGGSRAATRGAVRSSNDVVDHIG